MQAAALPFWMQALSALLTPTIAVIAGGIAFLQWRTAERKRKMDLFDKRYTLYKKIQQDLQRIVEWYPDDVEYDWRVLIYNIDELPFLYGPWASQFRLDVLAAFFGLQEFIIDIREGKRDPDKDYEEARNLVAKLLIEMPQTFWREMHLS